MTQNTQNNISINGSEVEITTHVPTINLYKSAKGPLRLALEDDLSSSNVPVQMITDGDSRTLSSEGTFFANDGFVFTRNTQAIFSKALGEHTGTFKLARIPMKHQDRTLDQGRGKYLNVTVSDWPVIFTSSDAQTVAFYKEQMSSTSNASANEAPTASATLAFRPHTTVKDNSNTYKPESPASEYAEDEEGTANEAVVEDGEWVLA